MPTLDIGPNDGIYYQYSPPRTETEVTFVFFNALTGDTASWEAQIAPSLRKAGHGTLSYNMRGQVNSPFTAGLKLDASLVVEDSFRLLQQLKPSRPVLVGLSIGGLFAAQTWLKGAEAVGLVLINTLREDGPRLRWIGDALVRAVEVGGLELFRDLFLPLLMNQDWLAAQRGNFVTPDTTYTPLDPASGHYKLLAEAGRSADWNLPYEKITPPTLVITGLQDHVFLERGVVDELFARLPAARRVDLLEAGHLVPAERPQALTEALLAFAKEVE
ncbi:MAG: hypothetical protein AMJ54_02325 [Deltaproteobacteria bacterium SG8_13]|nr:MAG: hypothetical protein AMJ54_02325 [Deltaproteobacteria bacterium SG8_13]